MHPYKFLAILLIITFCAKAQDGTIKVQRNPGRADSSLWCGGILQRSWFNLELSCFRPVHNPQDTPKKYSISDFIMQGGFGAHIILSPNWSRLNYGRVGSLGLSLVTGFDHFIGKEGDSLVTNINADQYHYKYSFNFVPLNLRLGTTMYSQPKFFLGMFLEGGAGLLFTKFAWTPNSFNKTEVVGDLGGGFTFGFRYGRWSDHAMNFFLKTKNIDGNWFLETGVVFPVHYGRDHR